MNHPGSTHFDAKDRLAIINLCNAYADGFDKNELDTWFTLFTDQPTCTTYLSDSEPAVVSGDDFQNLFKSFRQRMVDVGTKPMHLDTNLHILEQAGERAVAEAYMLYIPMEIAAFNVPEKSLLETRITGTARYVWNLLKGDDEIWRIEAYTIRYNQQVVEVSV
ncbi:MAG: hypothetical protein ACI9UU_001077 [Candidatus Azotimanducaceae bacterium]|jgi:hypothetical protein